MEVFGRFYADVLAIITFSEIEGSWYSHMTIVCDSEHNETKKWYFEFTVGLVTLKYTFWPEPSKIDRKATKNAYFHRILN